MKRADARRDGAGPGIEKPAPAAHEPPRPADVGWVPPRGPLVVGIVASAGGLDAFKQFFQALRPNDDMAFVVVPHLDPHRESLMAPLLGKYTRMPVSNVHDGERVERGHVYVLPPNRLLTVAGGTLHLVGPIEEGKAHTAIDIFLRSLADDQRECAVGIVLSGTGSHGTLGLRAIKANGGMTMAQDPRTAEFERMPQSAVGAELVDYVLPAAELPDALTRYAKHLFAPAAVEESDDIGQVIGLLRARGKFDFRFYRRGMLARRVRRRMGLAHVTTTSEYLDLLRKEAGEAQRLVADLFISVTSFFRDAEMYRLLETQVLPELVREHKSDGPLRVWVPACATGEEAYSLAMIILEQLAAAEKTCGLQLFATDVSAAGLETARRGTYPDTVALDVGPERLARHFTRIDDHSHQINKPLRDAVLFAEQNVLSDAPFSKLDLVACRNLLIYLEPAYQEKVISLLHFSLNDGGYLVLGPSESLGHKAAAFEPVSKKWRVFRRLSTLRREPVEFPIAALAAEPATPAPRHQDDAARAPGPRPLADAMREVLVEAFAPASVLVDRKYEVLYFSGPTERYLRHPAGMPTRDLTELVRNGLRARVRAALYRALREHRTATVAGAPVKLDGRRATVHVTARPMPVHGHDAPLVLITFEERSGQTPAKAPAANNDQDPHHDAVVEQLERELKSSREELQSAIEELESSNEELKASHEEVMSMNEELQSSNEELETSKEELQSLNEELSTVNAQLEEKVHELEASNSDTANLMLSAEVATVFLAHDGRIKRFTPGVTRLFNLIATDLGRPLANITPRFDDAALGTDIEAVLRNGVPIEKEVATDDDRWYQRRVTPYRTEDGRVDGVVLSFADVTALKSAQQALQEQARCLEVTVEERTAALKAESAERARAEAAYREEADFVRTVMEASAAPIVVRDAQGAIVRFNAACEKASGYTFAEIEGTPEYGWLAPEEAARFQAACDELRAEKRMLTAETVWHHRDGSERIILWNITGLYDGDVLRHTVRVGLDVTGQRNAESLARDRQRQLLHLYRQHTAGSLATSLAHELNQPLAALVAYCETTLAMMRAGETAPERLAGNLQNAIAQAHRASRIIRELRAFLANNPVQLEPVAIGDVIDSVKGLVEPDLNTAGVKLTLEIPADSRPVVAARIQLEQLLINLVQNSVQAMRDAGQKEGMVTIAMEPNADGMAHLSVTDSGPGLSREALERMFEPFYSTKVGSPGMGLAIARSIIEAHGGRLWSETKPNSGAIFHITIPFAK